VQLKGANSMAASGLVCRNNLVNIGRPISVLFGINGVKKQATSPCRPSISRIHGPLFNYGSLAFLKRHN